MVVSQRTVATDWTGADDDVRYLKHGATSTVLALRLDEAQAHREVPCAGTPRITPAHGVAPHFGLAWFKWTPSDRRDI